MPGTIDLATYSYNLELFDKSFTSGMQNAEKQTEKFKGKMGETTNFLKTSVVAGITAVSVALGGMALASGKAADEFQKAMNKLRSSTGATTQEIKRLEQSIKNIYAQNFGDNIEDIAQSMASVKQVTGATGAELESLVKNGIMLRDTFNFEVNESIRAASALMKNFGITGEQAFTLISQGAQNGADKNGDLLDTLNEYAIQFKSLGFNAQEFTNILIQGAQEGSWSIDKVGDAVKEFNIRAKDLSATTMGAFEALGLNAQKMSEDFASGGEKAQEAFKTVLSSLQSIENPLQRNQIGVALFGTMFEDLEAKAILSLGNVKSVADSTANTLEQINQIRYDSVGEAIEGIKRSLQTGLLFPIGQDILPLLNQFVNGLSSMIEMGGLGKTAIAGLLLSITGLTIGFASMIPVVKSAGVAIAGFTATIMTNPFGILAVSISATVTALTLFLGHQKQAREQQEKLNQTVSEATQRFNELSKAMNTVGEPTLGEINNTEELIKNYKELADSIEKVRKAKLNELKELDIRTFGFSARASVEFDIKDIPEELQELASKLDINITKFKSYNEILGAINGKLSTYNEMLKEGRQNSTEYQAEQIKIAQNQLEVAQNTSDLVNEYKELLNISNKNEQQTKRLAEVERILMSMFPEEFQNRKTLISSLEEEAKKRVELAEQGLGASREQLLENRKITQNAFDAAIKNIAIYQAEINKLEELWQARKTQGKSVGYVGEFKLFDEASSKVTSVKKEADDLAQRLTEIDNILNFRPAPVSNIGNKEKSTTSSIKELNYVTDKYAQSIAYLDTQISLSEGHLSQLSKTSDEYRKELNRQIYLLNRKQELMETEANNIHKQLTNTKLTAEESDKLREKLNGLSTSWWDVQNSMDALKFQKINSLLDEQTKKISDLDKQLKLSQSRMELQTEYTEEYNNEIKLQLDLLSQKQSLTNKEIASIQNLLRTEKLNIEQKEELQDKLDELTQSLLDYDIAIRKIRESYADEIIDQIKDILEEEIDAIEKKEDKEDERHQKRLDNIKEEQEAFEKAIRKQLDLIDKESEEEDYQSQLSKLQKEKLDLENQITIASLNTSPAGKAELDKLQKELTDKKEEIDKLQTNRQRELRKQNLEDQLDAYNEEVEAKEDAEDEKYDAVKEELDKQKQTLQRILDDEKYFYNLRQDIIEGNLDNVGEAFEDFEDVIKDSADNIGKRLKNQLIDKLQETKDLIEELEEAGIKNINKIIGGNDSDTNDNDNDSTSSQKTPPSGWTKSGSNYKKTMDGQVYAVTSDGGIYKNNNYVTTGSYKYLPSEVLDVARDRKAGYYADGGINDYTGLAMLHGTKTRPEAVLNYPQLNNLFDILNNPFKYQTPSYNIPFVPSSNTNNNTTNNYNFSINIEKFSGKEQDIDKLTNQICSKLVTGMKTKGYM